MTKGDILRYAIAFANAEDCSLISKGRLRLLDKRCGRASPGTFAIDFIFHLNRFCLQSRLKIARLLMDEIFAQCVRREARKSCLWYTAATPEMVPA